MNDNELLEYLLGCTEWKAFECKRVLIAPSKLLETVVAFANTDGGIIVIGLEDPKKAEGGKRLFGISEKPDNVSEFLKLINKEIDPSVRISNFDLEIVNIEKEKDKVVVVRVSKSNNVHSLKKGDTFVREGNQNVKIGSKEILLLQYEKGSVSYEEEISNVDSLDDLDMTLLNEYRTDTASKNTDIWQFLKDNGLARKKNNKFFLLKSGVLLFGKNPTILLKSKCNIKVSHYYGLKPNYTGEPNFVIRPFSIEGPLMTQIKKAVDYFDQVVKSSPPKLFGSTFRPSLFIPQWVIQEAVTNAVIHRNYFIQDDVHIRFFDDRIEVESPGSYPGFITVNNIRRERFARNPIIQRTLNRFQSAPNLDIGEGVDRMFQVMKDKNLYDPLYFPPSLFPKSVHLTLLNLQKIGYWDTVSKYLDEHYYITNKIARRITGISDTLKMSRTLKGWVNKGLLEKMDSRYKGNVSYKKPGKDIPTSFPLPFSKASENGDT